MRVAPVLSADKVWVRIDCDRGPYHWTAECVEGRALVELSRAENTASAAVQALCGARPAPQAGTDRDVCSLSLAATVDPPSDDRPWPHMSVRVFGQPLAYIP